MDSFPQVIVLPAEHHWLEIVFWISQIVIMIIAAGAAYFAYHHVKETREHVKEANEARKQALKISHANLILSLGARWDSAAMTRARSLSAKLREEINTRISTNRPLSKEPDKIALIKAEWKEVLAKMRVSDTPNYIRLLSICGFFENVGLFVKAGYITESDVFGLFRGSIMIIDMCFREHLEERSKELTVSPGYMEHVLYLCDLAKKANEDPAKKNA